MKSVWRERGGLFDSISRTTTDNEGVFILQGIPEEIECKVSAKAEGFSRSVPVHATPDGTHVVIRLTKKTGSVKGLISFTSGQPDAFEISLIPGDKNGQHMRKVYYIKKISHEKSLVYEAGKKLFEVDSKASVPFDIGDVDAGTYTLIVGGTGMYGPGELPGVTISPGEETTGIKIEMSAGGRIYGQVRRGRDHDILGGVRVFALLVNGERTWPRTSVTDGDGNFEIANLAPGDYEVWCEKENFSTEDNKMQV